VYRMHPRTGSYLCRVSCQAENIVHSDSRDVSSIMVRASISSGEFSSKIGTKASATEAILVKPALYF
jgi:hypothetical protein